MLVSKKLLSKLIPEINKMSDEKFTSICNKVGIEVEQIIRNQGYEGLEIALIKSHKPHPDSDHMNIVTIEKANGVQEVCCGATNVTDGKYAIFAPLGCKLPNGITIGPKNVRGVISNGMLCSFNEFVTLGSEYLSFQDTDNIVLLDKAEIGDKDLDKYLFTEDVAYDLSIPSNRNDLNSLQALAAEIRFGLNKEIDIDYQLVNQFIGKSTFKNVDLKVCSDIGFILIENIDHYEASWKEKAILIASGYKTQNNILDLMNLFTIYFGNPIHVYDADKVDFKKLSIKTLDKATEVETLDGNTYKFPQGTIAAYSDDKIISLPGIIGCENSKVDDNTKSIIIEVGNFNPSIIRKTSGEAKVTTKAQAIFSKPLASWITQNTFAELIKYFNDKKHHVTAQFNFSPVQKSIVAYDREEMYKFLGIKDAISFNSILEPEIFNVPPFRLDIQNQYDVFEEVLKTLDINKLEPEPIVFELNENKPSAYKSHQKLKSFLCHQGLLETKTYNLSSEEEYTLFNFFNIKSAIKVLNPISKAREYLRVNLIDEMLKVMQYNIARKRDLFNIFEIQNIQTSEDSSMTNLSLLFINDQVNKIVTDNIDISFINIKSLIKQMFKSINVDVTFDITSLSANEVNEKGLVIKHKSSKIGYITLIKKSVAKKYDILNDIYAVSIDISKFVNTTKEFKVNKVSSFPTVKRDVNITTANPLSVNHIMETIKNNQYVTNIVIKDIFTKDDHTVYTLGVDINSDEQTLSTEQIDNIMKDINSIIEGYNN